MADGVVTLNLRLPVELHARLKAQAERDRRSLNAEIIWFLDGATQDREEVRRGG